MKTFSNLSCWRWFWFWWNNMNVSWPISCFMRKMASNSIFKNKRKTTEELAKEQEMWIFANIECRVHKKVIFTWNSLFQAFHEKEFQVLLKYDPSTELNKGIYINIIKFGLHRAAMRTPVLSCPYLIEWRTQRVDHENREISRIRV